LPICVPPPPRNILYCAGRQYPSRFPDPLLRHARVGPSNQCVPPSLNPPPPFTPRHSPPYFYVTYIFFFLPPGVLSDLGVGLCPFFLGGSFFPFVPTFFDESRTRRLPFAGAGLLAFLELMVLAKLSCLICSSFKSLFPALLPCTPVLQLEPPPPPPGICL